MYKRQGFGKTATQSRELLTRAGEFRAHGIRVVVGHSRKSFLSATVDNDITNRDLATTGISMKLCAQGVDIIRVHNVPMHTATYRGWSLTKNAKL